MATYLVTLLAFTFPPALYPIKVEGQWPFLLLLFALTVVLPAINIGLFKLTGVISSFAMAHRSERTRPFFFILVLYGVFTYLLNSKGLNLGDNLFKLILIIDALVLVSLVLTLFFKVSIHSLGVWGVVGILMPLNKVVDDGSLYLPTLLSIVLAGIIMSARLQLNAHSLREVWVGSVAGFSVGFFGMLILF